MAVSTQVPFTTMFSRVDWKIEWIVFVKSGRFPPWCGCMAFQTIIRKICQGMIWIFGSVKICFMTCKTICRCIAKIIVNMTFRTIINCMSLGQWEKGMVEVGPSPAECIDVVAIDTVCGKSAQRMIWLSRCCIILLMAIVAFNTQRIKS